MVITHNLLAMNAGRMLDLNNRTGAKSTEKLSSGYKINRAADDAAGLAISEKMRRMIRELNQGAENTQDGISFVQIGDGAMEEICDIVNRITELSVKAANGTCAQEDRAYIDQEVQALKKEINRIADTTVFNEISVFDNHSVVFGLEGTPKDLQIFDATYDASGNVVTYGGFLFHGERITWDMIDSDMISIDSGTGKQVFNGGEYSYTSANTGYSFAFHCENGDVPPIITREISIAADSSGIILGKERFAWSQVCDMNGNACSESNLHAGPWAVDYYGAKFTFTVPDSITSLEELAKDVDSCKSASVSYNWEVYYKDGSLEKAVDVNRNTVDVTDNRVTQTAAHSMVTADKKNLEMTVKADDTGICLLKPDGTELAGSRKSWQDLGIASWDQGMKVPGLNNGTRVTYSYADNGTGLKFEFALSDITSKDSVIAGLDGMKITGTPADVQYSPTVETHPGNRVDAVTIHNANVRFAFQEELTIGRNFDIENWTMSSNSVQYNNVGILSADFDSGIQFRGATAPAESGIRTTISTYLNWVKGEKLNGNSSVSAADYTNTPNKVEITLRDNALPTRSFLMRVTYDYNDVFNDLIDNVEIKSVGTGHAASTGYYVYDAVGNKYVDSLIYLNNKKTVIDGDSTITDKVNAKLQAETDVKNMEKFQVVYKKEDALNTEVANAADVAETLFSRIFNDIANGITVKLTSQDYSRVNMDGDELSNHAKRPGYHALMKETPLKPDLYIVHSGQSGDATGIPKFAMNTTAMGIAFADCKTVETAEETLTGTRRALQYVAAKRSAYGAIQNRLEHTYNNNRNISENTSAAESRIRDTDMAMEMVKYSNINIIQQAGQAMLTQSNRSNQGVLSLLG